jgi:hypothetical protein
MRCLVTGLRVGFIVAICGSACGADPTPSNPISPGRPGFHTLSGVVRDGDRRPVGDVAISARPGGGEFSTATDSEGFFTLSIPPGVITINATRDGYQRTSVMVPVNSDTRFDIQLLKRTAHDLSGVVYEATHAGTLALEGALVEERLSRSAVHTDSRGIYRFPSLPGGDLWLVVSKHGYETQDVELDLAGDMAVDVELVRNP